MGNGIFWSEIGSGFGNAGGTPPPGLISRKNVIEIRLSLVLNLTNSGQVAYLVLILDPRTFPNPAL